MLCCASVYVVVVVGGAGVGVLATGTTGSLWQADRQQSFRR